MGLIYAKLTDFPLTVQENSNVRFSEIKLFASANLSQDVFFHGVINNISRAGPWVWASNLLTREG